MYEQHNLAEYATMSDEELTTTRHKKWQFLHDYATSLSDLILHNVDTLTPKDLALLDLVPYTVWIKIPTKTRLIIDHLYHER